MITKYIYRERVICFSLCMEYHRITRLAFGWKGRVSEILTDFLLTKTLPSSFLCVSGQR